MIPSIKQFSIQPHPTYLSTSIAYIACPRCARVCVL